MRKHSVTMTVGLFLLFGSLIGVLLYWWSFQKHFDKTKWDDGDLAFGYPERKYMLNDLLENRRIKGLSYGQLTEMLGKPHIDSGSNKGYYNIELDYGYDIDPVYSKDLIVTFNKDLIVASYEIKEWKH